MNLENRLRNHLHTQSDAMEVDTPGPGDVVSRSVARRRRRQSITVAVCAVAILGIGGWLIGAFGGGAPSTVEVASGDEDAAVTSTTVDEGTEALPDSDATAASSSATVPALEAPVDDIVRPEPGVPLSFTTVEDELAPGGWNVNQNGASGGLYYVLSTAPRATNEEVQAAGEEWPRNDTLYTWTGDEWTTGGFEDRFVSNLSASNDLLYSVSTGRRSGPSGLEIGSSNDRGSTWNWTAIDLSEQFGDDPANWPAYNARTATTSAGQLVVVSKAPGADWEQAIALAQDAGLDISWETHSIQGVDSNGITYGDSYQSRRGPCATDFEDAIIESGAYEWGEGLEYPTEDSTQEEVDAFKAEMQAGQDRYRAAADEILTELAARPECSDYVQCQRTVLAYEQKTSAESAALFEELGIDQYTDFWSSLTPAERAELDERQNAIYEKQPDFAGLDCEAELYGISDEELDTTTVTWESLGVNPPAAWEGSIGAYLVTDAGVTSIDVPFGPGYLDSVDVVGDSFAVRISEIPANGVDGSVKHTTWTSAPDGTWVETDGLGGFQSGSFAGASFRIDWQEGESGGEGRSAIVVRQDAAGTTGMRLEDLAPDLDTSGYQLTSLKTGGYGVVAVAVEWDAVDPESADNPGVFRNSIVLYSSDGITWGATELPGIEVTEVIVGDDGVMAFTTRPDLVGTTTPRPVLLGS